MRPPPQCNGKSEKLNFGHVVVSELGVRIFMVVAVPLPLHFLVFGLPLPFFPLGLSDSVLAGSVGASNPVAPRLPRMRNLGLERLGATVPFSTSAVSSNRASAFFFF